MNVKITIELEKLPNGVVNITRKIDGEGFMVYEIVGLLETVKSTLLKGSSEMAANIMEQNPDKPTVIKYGESPEVKEP